MFTMRDCCTMLMMSALLCALELSMAARGYAQATSTKPAPVVALSVNQMTGGAIYNGWPLVIQVDLYHPDFATNDAPVTPILLNTNSGSWADAVSITVTDSAGAQVNWPLHQVLRPTGTEAAITLDAETSGHLAWWIAPADTAGLPAGTYLISAVLDTTTVTDPKVFQGQAYSAPATLMLEAEPSVLLPDQFESKYLTATFYDTLTGNSAQAMSDVTTLLESQPQDIRGLMAKGELLESSGDTTNAMAAYEAAVDAFYVATPNPPEPPVELLEKSASLRSAAISQAAGVAGPQVTMQLQNFSQTSPGVYGLDLQVTNNGTGEATSFAISQITFATVSGSGQVALDASVPSQLPASLTVLAAGAAATVHFSVAVPAGVATFTAEESANVQDIVGTSSVVSGNQTVYVVTTSPVITSGNTASFQVGTADTFAVTTTGAPPPVISETGMLPLGLSFADGGNGAGTLAGTPAVGSGGVYGLTFQASNGVGTGASQSFTLAVNEAPAIASANTASFSAGSPGSFGVKATGYPVPTLSESGTLPSGVSFVAGTGTLSGTPKAGTGGVYPITFAATNSVATALQNFLLTVNEAPKFTSANTTTFTVGNAGSFQVTCTGFPTPMLTEAGALPGGMTFVDNGNGTATLAGAPTAAGTFSLVFAGSNSAGGTATQNFNLTVTGGGGGALVTVSPASVDFGKVQIHHRASQQITILNNGVVPVRVGRLYLTYGPHTEREEFSFRPNCTSLLSPGQSCMVQAVFEADELGRASAILHIVDTVAGSPQRVTLMGTAVR